MSLKNVITESLTVGDFGLVTIHRIDSAVQHRTMRLHAITWWVNKRMVGEPSWDGLDGEGNYLDGRTAEAKRYSFVIEADFLKEETKPDWTGFFATARLNATRGAVHQHVVGSLRDLLADTRKKEKKAALEEHRRLIGDLPVISQHDIGRFIDGVQERCPTLTPRDLSRTVEIYAKLEQTRTGYDLLKQLASCSPGDLDSWNELMRCWTAGHAELVLNELQKRLQLINRLQVLIERDKCDEVHELQPLFERGLWIFGPEYEAVDFRSNRAMSEIVRGFFKQRGHDVSQHHPDLVALADRSIGIYSADAYDGDGEVGGVRKVLIVELKRGGFELTQEELDQARNYAKEIRREASIGSAAPIVAYVLGASLEAGLGPGRYGEPLWTDVTPVRYDTLWNRAHARTFNLQRRLDSTPVRRDAEVEEVISGGSLLGGQLPLQ